MKVFFDNCTSPVLASTINGFIHHRGYDAVRIRDLPCGSHAKDVEWIEYLSSTGDEWLVITGDFRIHRNKAERFAYRQAGLRGFVLAPAYNKFPMNERASFMLWRWPDVEKIIELTQPPFLFELPAHRSSKVRPLPI